MGKVEKTDEEFPERKGYCDSDEREKIKELFMLTVVLIRRRRYGDC